MKKRILITGASGFIGSELAAMLGDDNVMLFAGWLKNRPAQGTPVQFDLRDATRLREVIAKVRPDVIIHCAYDKTAANRYEVIVNGTRNLVEASLELCPQVRFVFLSSEWVFDGNDGPYSETDIPNPQTGYGKAKLEAEKIVSDQMPNSVIIRTGLVSREKPLAPRWVEEEQKLLASERVIFYDNEIRNPIHVADLAKAIIMISDSSETGIWHVAGPEYLSRYAELELFVKWRKLDSGLISASHSDGKKRPLDCSIKIDKFTSRFVLKIRKPSEYFC